MFLYFIFIHMKREKNKKFMKQICIKLIKFYQKNISPLKRPCCRFEPTCSEYSVQAFSQYGFLRGFILSIFRIVRCNPFGKYGYDPLPERFMGKILNNSK